VQSSGNAAAIAAAFASRNLRALSGAFVDHLHQPFRKQLVPFFDDAIAAAEEAGALGGFLSGSGSTVAAVTLRNAENVAAAMLLAAPLGARVFITTADNRGARVLPLAHEPALRNARAVRDRRDLEPRQGVRASVLRVILHGLSFIYERIVLLRLFLYRHRIFREHTLGCLVISIGNLTVGGTGKTPIVEKFADALRNGGRRVAILSRGYKSVPQPTKKKWFARFRKKTPTPPRIVSDGKSLLLDSLTAGTSPTCSRTT
jgi:hypothetical protein